MAELGRALKKRHRKKLRKPVELYEANSTVRKYNVAIESQIDDVLFKKELVDVGDNLNSNFCDNSELETFDSVFQRPKWSKKSTPEQIHVNEQLHFLKFKKHFIEFLLDLYSISNTFNQTVTPFEKNLDIWRQLWRVCEISHIVCQYLESKIQEKYIQNISPLKQTLIILNKSDLLTSKQINLWKEYFNNQKLKCIFYTSQLVKTNNESIASYTELDGVFNRDKLIEYFKSIRHQFDNNDPIFIGFIGYPNVGKSSLINSLMQIKKTAVSSVPGKTKHLQSLFLDNTLVLNDCPGLVFPKFVSTKSILTINGILNIDSIRDLVQAIELLVTLIPRSVFQNFYRLKIPQLNTDNDILCSSEELLTCFACYKHFQGSKGVPDVGRAAKHILKDFGHLRYCYPPPSIDSFEFNFDHLQTVCELNSLPVENILPFINSVRNSCDVVSVDEVFFRDLMSDHILESPRDLDFSLVSKTENAKMIIPKRYRSTWLKQMYSGPRKK